MSRQVLRMRVGSLASFADVGANQILDDLLIPLLEGVVKLHDLHYLRMHSPSPSPPYHQQFPALCTFDMAMYWLYIGLMFAAVDRKLGLMNTFY